jgi:hypothetical protein
MPSRFTSEQSVDPPIGRMVHESQLLREIVWIKKSDSGLAKLAGTMMASNASPFLTNSTSTPIAEL